MTTAESWLRCGTHHARRFQRSARSEPTAGSIGQSRIRRNFRRAAVGVLAATALALSIGSGTAAAATQIYILGDQNYVRVCGDQDTNTNPIGVDGYWCEPWATNISWANEMYGWYWWGWINIWSYDGWGNVIAHSYCYVGGSPGIQQNGVVLCSTNSP
jgi:hypothetical protein